jgi:hypothetical protein
MDVGEARSGRQDRNQSAEGALPNRGPHFLTRRNSEHGTYQSVPLLLPSETLTGTDMRPTVGATQAAMKKRQRSRKSAQGSYRIRRRITWAIGACVAALSFVAVLWLTGPVAAPPAPGIVSLANATVSDATSLMAAVQTAGLRGTPDVKGAIEEIRRLDNDRVTIKGWAMETTASSSSVVTILAFASGHHVLTTPTNGTRAELAKMLGLADASQANMSFQGEFACRAGEKVIVIAVTSGGSYSQFRSLECP